MGPFFLVLSMIVYQSALIPRKPPCPKKILVTRLPNAIFCELSSFLSDLLENRKERVVLNGKVLT